VTGADQPGAAALTLLALAWALYFIIHSLLAGNRIKRWLATAAPAISRNYRLLYNAVALVALIPPLALQWGLSGPPLLPVPEAVRYLLDAVALVAAATFVWTLRWYDTRAFIGLPAAQPEMPGRTTLALSPLHRHVRHPWYFLALIVIWTRPLDAAWLVACLAITVYLVIGSRLEDHKLIEEFGEPYRRYCDRVPGLLPLPGRRLDAEEAARWVQSAGATANPARTVAADRADAAAADAADTADPTNATDGLTGSGRRDSAR